MALWEWNPDEVAFLKIAGTEYPVKKVTELDTEHNIIGEKERSAGGQLRSTVITVKRTWIVETAPMKPDDAYAIIDALYAINFTSCEFKLDIHTDYIGVFVEIVNDERVQFGENGEWYKDGRQLTFEIEEA